MKATYKMVLLLATALTAQGALANGELPPSAGKSYLGIGLLPVRYAEFPGPDSDVRVLRLSLLAGCNRTMAGLDFGTVGNWCEGDMDGLGFASCYNVSGGGAFAVLFAAGANVSSSSHGGVMLAAGANVVGHAYSGFQMSCVNYTEEAHCGVQFGMVNLTWGVRGVQFGMVNVTSEGCGLQFGLYNMAEDFNGLQFGLINMNQASPLMMMPFVNAKF